MYKSVKDCSSREAVLFQRLAFEKEWSDSGTAESLARRKAGTPKTKSLIEKNCLQDTTLFSVEIQHCSIFGNI